MKRLIAVAILFLSANAFAEPEEGSYTQEELDELAAMQDEQSYEMADEEVTVVPLEDNVVPGASQAIDEEALERMEHDDPHRVFADFTGLSIREEDGYGLRPNIGMRGTSSERSAKIALMEDGILIAPAPYSAPAAYYFPLLTKMTRVEVLKGPAAVKYGPNTVGGALNMVTRRIPREREAMVDVATGNDLYGKTHGYFAENSEHVGLLVEGLKLRTDGFKELDGGGDTGFDKNDVALKLRANTDIKKDIYNELVFRFGYSDEVSDETYAGLTDADFDANPYRRYRGTQLDRMNWQHLLVQLVHKVEVGANFSVTTQLYRHTFDRTWRKLNGFTGADISDVLANPSAGNNALLYAILTGETDSTSESEALIIGTNERSFVSQGVQTAARLTGSLFGFDHNATAGLRVHHDTVKRFHNEESFFMSQGKLIRTEAAMTNSRDTFGKATAVAVYAQDEATIGKLTLSFGNRVEMISIDHTDNADSMNNDNDFYAVLIPGGGAFYKVHPNIGLLAGIHKGFVPVAPGQNEEVNPEESINYELGTRYGGRLGNVDFEGETIGFFNDYSNLKGTCTFSSGCEDGQVGDEFNGGNVHTIGVEASGAATIRAGGYSIPLKANYTFSRSRFQTGFASANPQWGNVEEGDEVPYLPAHQLSVSGGIGGVLPWGHGWETTASGRFTSAMRDSAGSGDFELEDGTDSQMVVDAAASYSVDGYGKAYLTVSNVFDQAHIVSRRPFGARPGKPRFFILGYKNRF